MVKIKGCLGANLLVSDQPGVQKGCRGCRSAVDRRSSPNKNFCLLGALELDNSIGLNLIVLYANS